MQINLDTLVTNIRTILADSSIKYSKDAKKNETIESIKQSDIYLGAYEETDSFITYTKFSVEAITKAGLTAPTYDPSELASEKSKIPEAYRDRVVIEQRKMIIRDYVELNQYYRTLLGLPPLDHTEADWVYLPSDVYLTYNIPVKTPLHLVDADILYTMELDGVLSPIVAQYPTYKYLLFIGHSSIPVHISRRSNNFSIMKISRNVPDEFYSMFIRFYDQNREYYSSVIYNGDFAERFEYYDNFIGLSIMIMTIQRLASHMFKFGIERNFFDWSFIQAMYSMYNIPFIEDLPMEYHNILLKNLNNLLRHKSTDRVLFDIVSLLGYERMKIFKYYLVKQHKMDADNNPIFVYKEEVQEDGSTILVEDATKMYEIYFQAVDLRETNVALALTDDNNKKSYNEITSSDPYWWEDNDLVEAKFENEYNYVNSKYLTMNLMYKMTEMLFEITYSFRMILDKRSEMEKLEIALPKIYENKNFNLYDLVIFMVCLLCKKNGFDNAKTIFTTTEVAHFLGFNFDEGDIEFIKGIIESNRDKFDPQIVLVLYNMEVNTIEDANLLFENLRILYDTIVEEMYLTKDIKTYNMYRKIFDIIRITENNSSVYKILDENGDEMEATKYIDYLRYREPILADVVDSVDSSTINSILEHVLAVIEDNLYNLKYLYILNDDNSPVFKSISTMIKFFKSYTVDLSSFNIIYVFDSKHYQAIKFLDDITQVLTNVELDEDMNFEYVDDITGVTVTTEAIKEYYLKYEDILSRYIEVKFDDRIRFTDELYRILLYFNDADQMKLTDAISETANIELINGLLYFIDKYEMHISVPLDDKTKFNDELSRILLYFKNTDTMRFDESIYETANIDLLNDGIRFTDEHEVYMSTSIDDMLIVEDIIKRVIGSIEMMDILNYNDSLIEILATLNPESRIEFVEKIEYISTFITSIDDSLTFIEEFNRILETVTFNDSAHMSYADMISSVTQDNTILKSNLNIKDQLLILGS